MSKSLRRVVAALDAAGLPDTTREMPDSTRTAKEAAAAIGCHLDQIAKSIIFADITVGHAVLFITAGGNRVDPDQASALAGGILGTADAAAVRTQTGFAIGGVSPVGHLSPIRAWIDPRLFDFDIVYPAAGIPRHVFAVAPDTLMSLSGAVRATFTV